MFSNRSHRAQGSNGFDRLLQLHLSLKGWTFFFAATVTVYGLPILFDNDRLDTFYDLCNVRIEGFVMAALYRSAGIEIISG